MEIHTEMICPDCEENKIDMDTLYKYGMCLSCRRRFVQSKTKGKKYIKYKDLPEEEKERLRTVRARNKAWNAKRAGKDIGINDVYKEIEPELKKKTSGRGSRIITAEIGDTITLLASKDMTIKEVADIVINEYPNVNLNYDNVKGYITRYNLPHKKAPRGGRTKKSVELSSDVYKTADLTLMEVESDDFIKNEDVSEPNVENTLYKEATGKVDVSQEPERFKPIRAEVNAELENKYKELNCELASIYQTDDYMNMLRILKYLATDYSQIIKLRRDQHDVANAYQDDIIHEQENVIAEDGDTYLQDKLHILRTQRRYIEYDSNNVLLMKSFLETVDIEKLNEVLLKLEEEEVTRQNPIYLPRVDRTQIDKYDWAQLSMSERKSKILVTNDRMNMQRNYYKPRNKSNASKITRKAENRLFRVSCLLSGGGYGAFTNWYKDYNVAKSDVAYTFALDELNRMERESGVIHTELEVHEINR